MMFSREEKITRTLRKIPKDERWKVVMDNKYADIIRKLEDDIDKIDIVADVLSLLPDDHKYEWAESFDDEIKDGYDLACIAQHLCDKRLRDSYKYTYALENMARVLIGEEPLELPWTWCGYFVSQRESCITTCDQLLKVVAQLDEVGERDYFILRFSELVVTGEDVIRATLAISEETRHDFFAAHCDKINNGFELVKALQHGLFASDDDFQLFTKARIDILGTSQHMFEHVLEHVPEGSREAFIATRESYVASASVQIGASITAAGYGAFFTSHSRQGGKAELDDAVRLRCTQ